MPLYEYQCTKGHHFEVQQSMNDEPLIRCQENGCRAKAERLISLGGFALQGSGWYSDGYGGKSKGSNGGCDSAGACDAAKGSQKEAKTAS